MNDQQLQSWVERISLQWFGLPFRHQATFNRRLTSTGGRYFTGSHNIEISWKQLEVHGIEEVEKIIKHELCHYHLHLQNKGYQHRDEDFKKLLEKTGGSRYCKAVTTKRKMEYKYVYVCTSCGLSYRRKRKINTKKYVCGKCKGKLELQQRL
ncbi:SprT family protein [Marinicrinis lubricantis]|uniref:Protein SprT-like n=1 Tax=Marinicrinis lubricantis TaxID=2086470 RepID=A0ABW1ILD0_9BACL